ncbi:MAG: N-acetylglucosamine-6-phosphate deacetylase [Erysipelotrichaceae bacterium]|nr:N-acetylglucosamine-6-phosphate deacetylase [Erysipelotrichaceae bacterium]
MIIQSTNVYYDEKLQPKQLEIKDGKIKTILPYGTKTADNDYGDNWIIPGLIEIHAHGYKGGSTDNATEEWVREWVAYLPEEGVTSLVPGTSSCPEETMFPSMTAIANVLEEGCEGAHLLGIYSEGPFMSKDFRGAQDLRYLTVPDRKKIDEYIAACKGHLIYVMVAPEMLPDMDVIRYLRSLGIAVACGHTGASFEKITEAREAGAQSFTHTYNGMRGLHHREPGVVGAAMYYDDMYAELIGDGVHVSFPSMNVLAKIKGKDKLISVTDAVAAKGFPAGEYDYGGLKVSVCEDGVCRLPDGTICGSVNKLNVILGREITKANIPYQTAINSCTCNPAKLLGFSHCKGYLKENYDADICVLDQNFDVVQTYVSGKEML